MEIKQGVSAHNQTQIESEEAFLHLTSQNLFSQILDGVLAST